MKQQYSVVFLGARCLNTSGVYQRPSELFKGNYGFYARHETEIYLVCMRRTSADRVFN